MMVFEKTQSRVLAYPFRHLRRDRMEIRRRRERQNGETCGGENVPTQPCFGRVDETEIERPGLTRQPAFGDRGVCRQREKGGKTERGRESVQWKRDRKSVV